MALVSPGVEVSIIDESVYAPESTGTIPLIILATGQDKTGISGTGTATATTKANAGKLAIVSSQRELATLYGAPKFETTTSGTPVHGSEVNEYGLMAAYSLLGVTNNVMTVRADVDLTSLKGTTVRPRGKPANGLYWLDASTTAWGLFAWNAGTQSFSAVTPAAITSTSNVTNNVPNTSFGNIGDYAVVTTSATNPVFYKAVTNTYNSAANPTWSSSVSWVAVGSAGWQGAIPTVTSTVANPTLISGTININTVAVTSGISITALANNINQLTSTSLPGVNAAVVNGFLQIYVTSAAKSTGAGSQSSDGKLLIAAGTLDLTTVGLTAATYNCPATSFAAHTSVPQWRASDSTARPTGSVWVKTNTVNAGANIVLKRYNLSLNQFTSIAAPLYATDQAAIAGLDASGGKLIGANAVYAQYNTANDGTITYKLFRRTSTWPTKIVASSTAPTYGVGGIVANDEFTIQVSVAGSATMVSATITVPANPSQVLMVAAINSAGLPNLTATLETGAISLTHALGGVIVLKNTTNTPVTMLGFTTSTTGIRAGNNSELIASNWTALTYTVDTVQPSTQPTDGTYWYYSAFNDIDIMVSNGTAWKGYQNVTSDARGFNLSQTDANGVIVSASKPTTQSNGTSALVNGDLWLDSSDLENYPKLSRWQTVNGISRWALIDNSDQTTESGIVFADARWSNTGLTNIVTDNLVTTKTLLTSDYLDIDAPDVTAYPRGTLLFNTRRSGYNVKEYQGNYFTADSFQYAQYDASVAYTSGAKVVYSNGTVYKAIQNTTAGTAPSNTAFWTPMPKAAWVSSAGNRLDGSMYAGHRAVRAVVVEALKSAIDSSTEIREEQREFTLIACPGYPELIPNMVALNNDRHDTAFVIGDTPMRLAPTGVDIQNWSNGTTAGTAADESLQTADPYLGVYYPSGITNDLSGNVIAVPPSHVVLRTMVRSDAASYPWFAPAGTRRGLVDNITSTGYINNATGEFVTFGLPIGLRDTLYATKINPIVNLPGTGLTVYGQKTRNSITSALDRVNVARLINYIRDRLNKLARPFIFEPNDKITRDQIKQITEQMLNDLVAKRGLYDYLVVCDTTNNTPVRIDRNELWLDVAIEPVKAVEFIYIPVRIKNTGAITGNF